jgi:hypothetical protein
MNAPIHLNMKEFGKHFMKLDPAFWYVAVAFLIACIYPVYSLRDDVLGKSCMVAFIIAMTLYNRIAGIVALIFVIALLNRTPVKEGLTFATPTPAPISFKSPDEFRQKYCLKGIPDDPTQSGKLEFNYMLSPDFFTLDASGNPTMTMTQMDALGKIVPNSFNKCTPLTVKNGGVGYETIHNMCDPACDWTMKSNKSNSTTALSTAPSAAPSAAPSTIPTTDPAIPSLSKTTTTEGFNPMSALRPHIRTGRHILTDGAANVKSFANRMKRQLF